MAAAKKTEHALKSAQIQIRPTYVCITTFSGYSQVVDYAEETGHC